MKEVANIVAERAFPLSARSVVDKIPRGAEWVLIGEASHGTREFYEIRAGKQSCSSPNSSFPRKDTLRLRLSLGLLHHISQLLCVAEITKVLIQERGFNAVAAEAGAYHLCPAANPMQLHFPTMRQ